MSWAFNGSYLILIGFFFLYPQIFFLHPQFFYNLIVTLLVYSYRFLETNLNSFQKSVLHAFKMRVYRFAKSSLSYFNFFFVFLLLFLVGDPFIDEPLLTSHKLLEKCIRNTKKDLNILEVHIYLLT